MKTVIVELKVGVFLHCFLHCPEIEQSGATVVGKGKAPYTGGTKIPPTKVEIIRK